MPVESGEETIELAHLRTPGVRSTRLLGPARKALGLDREALEADQRSRHEEHRGLSDAAKCANLCAKKQREIHVAYIL